MGNFTTKYCNLHKISHSRVVRELVKGRKWTPWLFFTFPCVAGRFKNPFTKYFEIKNKFELDLFVSDKLLSRHLRHYTRLFLALDESNIESILGKSGAERLKSSLTMLLYTKKFKHHAENLLNRYYNGDIDTETKVLVEKETFTYGNNR